MSNEERTDPSRARDWLHVEDTGPSAREDEWGLAAALRRGVLCCSDNEADRMIEIAAKLGLRARKEFANGRRQVRALPEEAT